MGEAKCCGLIGAHLVDGRKMGDNGSGPQGFNPSVTESRAERVDALSCHIESVLIVGVHGFE